MDAATELNTPMKPEDVPMMMGTLPPIGPMPNSWTRVTTPAIHMAFCSSESCTSANSAPARPHAPVTIKSGVRLPTNIASTCCRPSGTACASDMSPSNEKTPSDFALPEVSSEPAAEQSFS